MVNPVATYLKGKHTHRRILAHVLQHYPWSLSGSSFEYVPGMNVNVFRYRWDGQEIPHEVRIPLHMDFDKMLRTILVHMKLTCP